MHTQRARAKFGFRSKALSLQVKLAERLRLATDQEKRFYTIQQVFEEVIRIDYNFTDILKDIKLAYDAKTELVASKDTDAVSLAAYEALRNRERIALERNASLQNEVHVLRELAAQVCVCECVCYVYMYMYMYIYRYIHVYIYICMHAYVHIYMYIHMYMYRCIYI